MNTKYLKYFKYFIIIVILFIILFLMNILSNTTENYEPTFKSNNYFLEYTGEIIEIRGPPPQSNSRLPQLSCYQNR